MEPSGDKPHFHLFPQNKGLALFCVNPGDKLMVWVLGRLDGELVIENLLLVIGCTDQFPHMTDEKSSMTNFPSAFHRYPPPGGVAPRK
jgi:hypothetical protein